MKKQAGENAKNNKIIVILGPTSSGKSDLAVYLAKKFNGEVVSADSRQVYKSLDIGTGKITTGEMKGVPHHLLDVANPCRAFNVAQYKTLAENAINNILLRYKLPILTGGTGQYISTIVDGISFPEVTPNEKLRKKLENKSPVELFEILKKLDSRRAIEIDQHNPRRLIRAIEIASALGSVPKIVRPATSDNFETLQIGIKTDQKKLAEKIHERILTRLKKGMLAEVKHLHEKGLSWKRMETLGLEYRFLSRHLRGQITKPEMIEQLHIATRQYAKRQRTWWRRDDRIRWFTFSEIKKIESEIKKYLKK